MIYGCGNSDVIDSGDHQLIPLRWEGTGVIDDVAGLHVIQWGEV